MIIMSQTVNENSDAENVRKNITQRNVITQQFNAYIARNHMKLDIMNILHESPRKTDLKNCGIDARNSSSTWLLMGRRMDKASKARKEMRTKIANRHA